MELAEKPVQQVPGSIRITNKKAYNMLQKMFCCRFLHCCQANDQSLLTSKDRKTVFLKLIKRYQKLIRQHQQVKPFHMLMALLIQNGELYSQMMQKVRIHTGNRRRRQDLQFYIPQLGTYLIFHEEMHSPELVNLLERACKLDLHFAHRFYFYLHSLCAGSSRGLVGGYLERLMRIMGEKWKVAVEEHRIVQPVLVEQYNERPLKDVLQPAKIIVLQVASLYRSVYQEAVGQNDNIFQPTIAFLSDLVLLAERLFTRTNRREFLLEELRKINRNLPARISLPLYKSKTKTLIQDSIRQKTVLGIVFEQSKVFTTKTRAPFSICLEVFNDPGVKRGLIAGSCTDLNTKIRQQPHHQLQQSIDIDILSPRGKMDESGTSDRLSSPTKTQQAVSIPNRFLMLGRFFKLTRKTSRNNRIHLTQQKQQRPPTVPTSQLQPKQTQPYMSDIFGEAPQHRFARISKYSPYSQLPGYGLVHLIVKSNDNLKQQQFAMQLLQNFQDIFLLQSLPLQLHPYQIVSISPNSGIIQFMQDCLTIDELKRRDSSIQAVVQGKQRITKFLRSLAAYSLVTYLLQVKDRHNGNIMICRDGSLRHIDYGFFISNSPGKGVEIERNVPFKLPVEYVRVLGGLDSKHFQEFRKLFYQGFNAARKHQDRIMILVNLMYSSEGAGMPCFGRGEEGIQELERRFNPERITTDIELSMFCQSLINASIDNWRARWYDKWQYFAQGILY